MAARLKIDPKPAQTDIGAIYCGEIAVAPALVKPPRAGYNAARSRIDRGSVSLDHPTLVSLMHYCGHNADRKSQ
jgi:hypothetical protein